MFHASKEHAIRHNIPSVTWIRWFRVVHLMLIDCISQLL